MDGRHAHVVRHQFVFRPVLGDLSVCYADTCDALPGRAPEENGRPAVDGARGQAVRLGRCLHGRREPCPQLRARRPPAGQCTGRPGRLSLQLHFYAGGSDMKEMRLLERHLSCAYAARPLSIDS